MSGRARQAIARRALATLAALPLAIAAAHAQVAATVTATNDYRYRGVSQGDGRPALQLAVEGEGPADVYGGLTATQVAVSHEHRYVELGAYGGRVLGASADALRLELGAKGSHFAGDSSYDYFEAYAGLLGERWHARLYLSPDYFGRGTRTVYVELNADRPLGRELRVFAHAGAIAGHGGPPGIDNSKVRFDFRIGGGWARTPFDVQLAWVGATGGGPYPAVFDTRRQALVATASVSF